MTRSRWETDRGVFTCGPARKGDLSEFLCSMGWAVCSVDIAQIHATDLLDDRVTSSIMKDLKDGMFDFVLLGTGSGSGTSSSA